MPVWLDTRGMATYAIGVCDRCKRKFPLLQLRPDGNSPGLRVCEADWDQLDPYRLPARQPENITLPFYRPDVNIATDPAGVVTESDNQFIINEGQDEYYTP